MITHRLLVARAALAGARIGEYGVHHRPRTAGRQRGADPGVVIGAFRELRRIRAELDATSLPPRAPSPGAPASGRCLTAVGRARAPALAIRARRVAREGVALAAVARCRRRAPARGASPPDPFYDAAVRSMAKSWHEFLVGAFEPGARVAIDKPPARSLAPGREHEAPRVLDGRARAPGGDRRDRAVAAAVRPRAALFGGRAGLAAAAAMAVLPVAVVTARSDTMDR